MPLWLLCRTVCSRAEVVAKAWRRKGGWAGNGWSGFRRRSVGFGFGVRLGGGRGGMALGRGCGCLS